MRLSSRVWKILRSRRTMVAIAWSPFIAATLIALSYPLAAWYGRRSFDQLVNSMRAKGNLTNAQDYFSVGDRSGEDNFFQHPAMIAEESEQRVRAVRHLEPPIPGLSRRPERGEPSLACMADIRTWLEAPPADEKEAARHLLTAIELSSLLFKDLREALKRPRADHFVKGSLGTGSEAIQKIVASQFRLRPVADFAADEAYLHLAGGDTERAASNVETMLDCHRLYFASKPTFVAPLLAGPLVEKTGDLIWEGIARTSWTDHQLSAFEATLSKIDPQQASIAAFRGEAALTGIGAELASAVIEKRTGACFSGGWKVDRKVIAGRLRGIWREVRPSGVSMTKHVKAMETLFHEGTSVADAPRKRFEPEDLVRFRETEASYPEAIHSSEGGTSVSQDLDAVGWSALKKIAGVTLRSEAQIALTRTGIALERHRLKHGTHPASLEELVPAFLPAVPLDPFTRQPLLYRHMADGSPHVWSIGPNLTDEGGLPRRSYENGDLVWITRPLPGYTEKQFKAP